MPGVGLAWESPGISTESAAHSLEPLPANLGCFFADWVTVQFEVQLFSFPRGVILTAAAFQAEGRILRAERRRLSESSDARSLSRLNCAGFRDDAFERAQRSKLHRYRGLCRFDNNWFLP